MEASTWFRDRSQPRFQSHLVQESEVLLSGSQHMVQRQVTAQGSSRAVADQHQGHQ